MFVLLGRLLYYVISSCLKLVILESLKELLDYKLKGANYRPKAKMTARLFRLKLA